jgi:hypothetical protein
VRLLTAELIIALVGAVVSVLATIVGLGRARPLNRFVLPSLARLLPEDRERYIEEWRAELNEMPRFARPAFVLGILLSLPRFIRILRKPTLDDHCKKRIHGGHPGEVARGQI